jgi:hypothetical protein
MKIDAFFYGDNGNFFDIASFANAHGKAMMFPEIGDNFGDRNYYTRLNVAL